MTWLRAALAFALTFGLLVAPAVSAPEAIAASKPSLKVSPSKPIANEKFTISGALRTKAARRVDLQRKSGSKWVRIGKSKTTATGAFSFKTSQEKKTKYRVVAARTAIRGKTYAKVTSKSKTVSLATQTVAFTSLTSSARVGEAIKAVATVSPARVGRTVHLQVRTSSGWAVVASAAQNASGSSTLVFKPTTTGTFTYRVVVSAANGAPSKTSPAKTASVKSALAPPPPLVNGERTVRAGLFFVDMDKSPLRASNKTTIDMAAISSTGGAAVYRSYYTDAGSARNYSLEWRNLRTGRSLSLPGVWAYSLDISGDGRWVVFVASEKAASTGQVIAEKFVLWDTDQNTMRRVDLRSDGTVAGDGMASWCERAIDISDDGSWVVFSSDSKSMAPAGATAGIRYSFAYQRSTAKVKAVPWQADRPADCARVSNAGTVALFPGSSASNLAPAQLWNLTTDSVRAINQKQCGSSSAEPAEISADGASLVYRSYGIVVTHLGATTSDDSTIFRECQSTEGYASPAISSTGSSVAYFSGSNDTGLVLNHLDVATGATASLAAPGNLLWLEPGVQAGAWISPQLSLTADGKSVFATPCSRGTQTNPFRYCNDRSDIFRWSVG